MRGSNHQLAPVDKARAWLTVPHRQCAVWLLRDYYERPFRGAKFDDVRPKLRRWLVTERLRTTYEGERRVLVGQHLLGGVHDEQKPHVSSFGRFS